MRRPRRWQRPGPAGQVRSGVNGWSPSSGERAILGSRTYHHGTATPAMMDVFFFGQVEALDSGRCQVRSGHGKSSHLGSSPPEGERARERAGEQWLEPHGSVRLDIVDMMDMVVSLVCACARIGEHLDLLDGTKQNQGGGGQVWTGLAATAANGSGCAWCMARMGRGDMPMRGLPRRTISGGLAARGGGVPLASCERSWAYQ